jgi:hypothetical protein
VSVSGVIYSAAPHRELMILLPKSVPRITDVEETKTPKCVSSDHTNGDHSSQGSQSAARVTYGELRAWVEEAFDAYPGRAARHKVRAHVELLAGGRPFSSDTLERLYCQERDRRRYRRSDERSAARARALSTPVLKRRSQALASQAAAYARRGDPRASVWRHLAGIYAVEETRREQEDLAEPLAARRQAVEACDADEERVAPAPPPPCWRSPFVRVATTRPIGPVPASPRQLDEADPWTRLQRGLLERAEQARDWDKVAFYRYVLGEYQTLEAALAAARSGADRVVTREHCGAPGAARAGPHLWDGGASLEEGGGGATERGAWDGSCHWLRDG